MCSLTSLLGILSVRWSYDVKFELLKQRERLVASEAANADVDVDELSEGK